MHGVIQLNEERETFAPVAATGWYALLVQSGKERQVCIWLRRRQYEPYWPRFMGIVKLNRHRKAKRWCSVMPGYLFLPDAKPIDWSLVEEAQGVHGFMSMASGDLVVIPHRGRQGIEQIRSIEAACNADAKAAAFGIPFKKGQLVKIDRLETHGEIIAINNRRQIFVEVQMFGRATRLALPVDEIEAA